MAGGAETDAEVKELKKPKADVLHRVLAKFIDFLIMGGLMVMIRAPIGYLAGLTYILLADGLFAGRSLGKRLIGLRVMVVRDDMAPFPCQWRQSMIRNLPCALVVFLSSVPSFLGIFLFITVGILITLAEVYFVYSDERGVRLGDIFAETQVVDH